MKTLRFKITGTKPLLFHKFNVEIISNMKKVKSGSAGNDPEEWKLTFFEKGGQLYLPAAYWFSTLCAGGMFTKVGRGTLKNKIPAAMNIVSDITLLNRHMPKDWQNLTADKFTQSSGEPVYLDIRGVMNPNSKGRNVRYRVACSPGWETDLEIEFDDTVLSESQMIKVVQDSGQMVGIADGRTLGNGRFIAEIVK
jgi:hypothetical protein